MNLNNINLLFKNKTYVLLFSIIIILVICLLILIYSLFFKNNANTNSNKLVKINFWTRSGYINSNAIQELIKKFEEENPNIKINHEYQSDTNYKDRIFTRLKNNTGELPNILEIEESWLDEIYLYLKTINNNEITSRYTPVMISNNSVYGDLYAVPFQFDTLLLAYNVNYLSSLGLTEKDLNKLDWTKLALKAKELTQTKKVNLNNNEYEEVIKAGIAVGSPNTITNANQIIKLLILQNNLSIYDTTSQTYKFDPKLNDVFDFYLNFTKNNIWSENLGNDIEAFAREKTSMVFVRSKDIDEIKKLNPNLNFNVTITPQISIIKGISLSKSLVIPNNSSNYKETIKFLEFITRPENSLILYNQKDKYTFIPSQIESLNKIPKDSVFSVFSNISTSSEKLKIYNENIFNQELNTFLLQIYSKITNNNINNIPYDSRELINKLNNSMKNNSLFE